MKHLLSVLLLLLLAGQLVGQQQKSFFAPADTFDRKRFNAAVIGTSAIYVGSSIGLYNAWYRQYPQGAFQFFDDRGEWMDMDKIGHVHSAYNQARIFYGGAKWTGLSENNSILTGLLLGGIFQSTIEVMDGFSTNWGFSATDFGANIAGLGLFYGQQKLWKDQFIQLKVSSWPQGYSTTSFTSTNGLGTTNLEARADELFGSSWVERYLKDYNQQTYWLSFDVHKINGGNGKWPSWLNIAVGTGANNMFGGFNNQWVENGNTYVLSETITPRYREYYLGIDLNLAGIKTKSPFLKGLLDFFDTFRIPLPALRYDRVNGFAIGLY